MSPGFDWSAIRILVVDRDRDFFRLVAGILHREKVGKIEYASGASQALNFLKWESFDIVITEYRLAELNGLALAEILRNRKKSPRVGIPIIMLTGESSEPLLRRAIKAGIDHFLIKPISPAALCTSIEKLLVKPLPLTKTKNYIGPCRRRVPGDVYAGPFRRNSDEEETVEEAANG